MTYIDFSYFIFFSSIIHIVFSDTLVVINFVFSYFHFITRFQVIIGNMKNTDILKFI